MRDCDISARCRQRGKGGARPPLPVYIAGQRYSSLFAAAIETGLTETWLSRRLGQADGRPVIIRRQSVVLETWLSGRAPCGRVDKKS